MKCLVQNIVVDISFNQLGGLCTLCFLEQVWFLLAYIDSSSVISMQSCFLSWNTVVLPLNKQF